MWYQVERLRDPQKLLEESPDTPNNSCCSQALLTDKIMKLAKAQLVLLNSKKADVLSSGKGCFRGQCGVSSKVAQDLELALLVQAAAEKVEDEKFVYARKLLNMCDVLASKTDNSVQRVVYYFAKALNERIDQEWGIISSDKLKRSRMVANG